MVLRVYLNLSPRLTDEGLTFPADLNHKPRNVGYTPKAWDNRGRATTTKLNEGIFLGLNSKDRL